MRTQFFAQERDKTFHEAWEAAKNKNKKEMERLVVKHENLCRAIRASFLEETTFKPK